MDQSERYIYEKHLQTDDEPPVYHEVRCRECGKTIAVIRKIDTGYGYKYEGENLECRFIDKWGCARNFCKDCMR